MNDFDFNDDEILDLISLPDEIDEEDGHQSIDTMIIKPNVKSKDNKCPECDNVMIHDTMGGFIVCNNCGYSGDNIIDMKNETNNYDNSTDDTSRCGTVTNPMLPQTSLVTKIACSPYNRIRIQHRWLSVPYAESSRMSVFELIKKVCKTEGLMDNIIKIAEMIYYNVSIAEKPNNLIKKKKLNRSGSISESSLESSLESCKMVDENIKNIKEMRQSL